MTLTFTFRCLIQNRLGALDRILGAFTFRGLIPREMTVSADTSLSAQEITLTVGCQDQQTAEKLLKTLEKQVYVLKVTLIPGLCANPVNNPLPHTSTQAVTVELHPQDTRRFPHVRCQ